MINLDEKALDQYKAKMKNVLAKRRCVENIVDDIMKEEKKNLFLLGIGGTIAIMLPFVQMFGQMSDAEVYPLNAAEYLAMGNKKLTKESVVFCMSDSGNTKEIVEALKSIKEIGATTVAVLGAADSPIEKAVDYSVVNLDKAENSCDADYFLEYLFFSYFLHKRGEFDQYERFISNLEKMPNALADVKLRANEEAKAFVENYGKENYHIFTAGGNVWGEVFCYAMCVLEEMQWVRTKSVHAVDFFHGTLELVDNDTHVVLVKGEDEFRHLSDRIENFCRKYTKKLTVYDTKNYELPGIDAEFRGMLSPIVTTAALGRISPHMEYLTGHSLSFRRYYKVVEY